MRFIILLLLLFISDFALAREQLRIVGSSTLYPFVTIASERFGKISGHTPVVEATGTGGGFYLLCSGNSLHYPDIVNASRKIKKSEQDLCKKNGVNSVEEIIIGHDGIILAQSIDAIEMNLTKKQLFLALAKEIPSNGKMILNPYINWQQIDQDLPDLKIEVYGPSFTSGTRDAFVELVMHKFCESSDEIKDIFNDNNEMINSCSTLREDGIYIEMSENDNLIVQKLLYNKKALGIISFSLLSENPKVKAASIEGIIPTVDSITSMQYLISRPLFLYINLDHLKYLPSISKFIEEITSKKAVGEDGYLTQKGLLSVRD